VKLRSEVTAEKLRGGFYSPAGLVQLCLARIHQLTMGQSSLRVLEPSAGAGAFIHGIASSSLKGRVAEITAIELRPEEAAKCRRALCTEQIDGKVVATSFVKWTCRDGEKPFDVAVGNPPFVRFQFVTEEDRAYMPYLARRLHVSFGGVSNLWIPIFLAAVDSLRDGGAFAFIIPTECLTGITARTARSWLASHVEQLQIDLFVPGSFPTVLQEVMVVSGVRRTEHSESHTQLAVVEHRPAGVRSWTHRLNPTHETWTRYLLSPSILHTLDEASDMPSVRRLGSLASFEVAAVTGANEFFSVDPATSSEFGLDRFTLPLLPRLKHAKGLVYASSDHLITLNSGARSLLLDFSADRPDPSTYSGPRRYLQIGQSTGLPARYKCRIREPWYRIPHIRPGSMMLSKRSHLFPRMVLNEAGVVTTDTIYRGELRSAGNVLPSDFVAAFHNSVTLLSAEIEGRTFGGGVLELVPTEIRRLRVVAIEGFGKHLEALDHLARAGAPSVENEGLIEATDRLLMKEGLGISSSILVSLREGRRELLGRRLERNGAATAEAI
jgi:adenine-specific DNA methylase